MNSYSALAIFCLFLGGVSMAVGVMSIVARHNEGKLQSKLLVAECSFKGQAANTKSRVYVCPDGLMYVVDRDIRNAKGE